MQKYGALLILGSLFFLAAGCNHIIDIHDGKVPEQYLPLLQEIVGGYTASSNGNLFDIHLKLENDHSLNLLPDQDVLGPICQSKVLDLSTIRLNDKKLSVATFRFDPGLCANEIEGRFFHAAFGYTVSGQFGFNFRILKYNKPETECHWRTDFHGHLEYYCRTIWVPIYLKGMAIKKEGVLSNYLRSFLFPLSTPWENNPETDDSTETRDFRGRR